MPILLSLILPLPPVRGPRVSVLQWVMRDHGSAALRLFEDKAAEPLLFDLFPFPMSLCLLKSFLHEHYLVGMHIFCSQIVKKKTCKRIPKAKWTISRAESYFVIMPDYPAIHANKLQGEIKDACEYLIYDRMKSWVFVRNCVTIMT